MNTLLTRFVTNNARFGSMAKKHGSVKRDPLAPIFMGVSTQPLQFVFPLRNLLHHRNIGDRNEDMLLLSQRQGLKRSQNAFLEYSFHLSHHVLIVAADRAAASVCSRADEMHPGAVLKF